jgi:ABC-type nickel/cobalt efflux system permease component RcnA
MRLIAVVLAAAGLLFLWQAGAFTAFGWWLMGLQRELQSILGAHVAALRAGEPGALATLVGFCALSGFLHAVGPGHGKVLVGAAAIATNATARRMAAIAVAGSVAQSLVAIVLIYGGFFLIGATARATVATSEAWALPAGHAAVAVVGAWIVIRGVGAWRRRSPERAHGHADGHGGDHHGAHDCGHHHGPGAHEVAGARGLPGALLLVGAMAARPCTGAMMLLAIAWGMGVAGAGAAGVLAMGLGTALFTVAVAVLAVFGRAQALARLSVGGLGGRLVPALQVVAGILVATTGSALLVSSLSA